MSGRWDYLPLPGRPAGTWPNGARVALYVAVGVEEYRFGDGYREDVLADVPAPDLVNAAWRDYGNRVGAFRVLDRLSEHGVRPALLLNTDVYDTASDVVEAARTVGAEIVAHGVSNSDSLTGLSPDAERAYLCRVAQRIAEEEGARPGGWSSPWLTHTPSTVDLLGETGYDYLLDLRLDDQPVWMRTRKRPLLAIPYNAEINDSSTMIGRSVTAGDFADMIVDEFDELRETSEDHPVVMSVVVHSFISGAPFRLRQLGRALEHIDAHADTVWRARPKDVYAFAVAHPELFPRAQIVPDSAQEGAS